MPDSVGVAAIYRRRHLFSVSTLLLVLLAILTSVSPTRAQQHEDPSLLQVRTELTPIPPVLPKQRIRLTITLITNRWFTGATKLKLPELTELLLLNQQTFAVNGTEQRDGVTLATQRWTLDLFALNEGEFQLPSIEVTAQVSTSGGNSVRVARSTEPMLIKAELPEPLRALSDWVASPEVTLEQRIIHPAGRNTDVLQPGDALIREIEIKAVDVMAMMLPEPTLPLVKGFQSYADAPVVNTRSNRGTLVARRSDRHTFIATQAGTTEIPAMTVYWWNSAQNRLDTAVAPAIELQVAAPAMSLQQRVDHHLRDALERVCVASSATAALLLIVAVLAYRQRQRLLMRFGTWLALRARLDWLSRLREPALPAELNPDSSPQAPLAKKRPSRG